MNQDSSFELDKTLALIGLVVILAVTIFVAIAIRRPIWLVVGTISFLACAGYLVLRRFGFMSSALSSMASARCSKRAHLGLNALFYLFFAYSILSLVLRSDPYSRPLGYFVAISLMVSIAAVEILFLPSTGRSVYLCLSKIIMIGLSLVLSEVLIFPSLVGIDPFGHQTFTSTILTLGHIPEGYAYSQLPLMHILIASTMQVTGLDYKTAAILSVSVPLVVCSSLSIFLLGRKIFNYKTGLLGALILAVANWNIWMGYLAIPNTMAAIFVLVAIYALFAMTNKKSRIALSIVLMLQMGALILTHTVTSAWMAILLFVFWIVYQASGFMHLKKQVPVIAALPILFAVGMFSWWTYASGNLWTLGKLIAAGFSVENFIHPMPAGATMYLANLPLSEQVFNNLGMFLFFGFSIVGCLYMVSKKYGQSGSLVLAACGVLTLALAFFPITANILIIPERWMFFSQLLLALPVALAICLLSWIPRNRLAKSILIVGLTLSLSFFMIMSPSANFDNPTLSPNTQIRYAFTQSELTAFERMTEIGNNTIGTDAYCSMVLNYSYPRVLNDISDEIYNQNFTECESMTVLIREEIINKPFLLFQTTYRLNYDPEDVLTNQGFSRIYDCGSVSAFVYSNSTYP